MDKDTKQALEIIKRGSDEIIPEDSFKKLLTSKKKLTVKAGFDPTSADLHLGHTVLINKLKAFQDLGHTVIFLIGDFTGLIGDPSGVNETRPNIDEKKLAENSKTYADQVFKILDKKKTKIQIPWFRVNLGNMVGQKGIPTRPLGDLIDTFACSDWPGRGEWLTKS